VGVLEASTSPPKERYGGSNDIVVKLIQPGALEDQLTEVLRQSARTLLAQGVAGGFQPLATIGLGQAQDANAGAEALPGCVRSRRIISMSAEVLRNPSVRTRSRSGCALSA
jgi:hypothetical protein